MANEAIKNITQQDYKWGFVSPIESDFVPKGLNEDIIRLISRKKNEPEWLTDLFYFAPAASEHHVIEPPARQIGDREGFVEFSWRRLDTQGGDLTKRQLMDRTQQHLRALARQSPRA